MAHGDYDCCAVCDRKMAYSHDADTKEAVCTDCGIELFAATGERITTGEALVEWIERTGAPAVAVLDAIGFSACFYSNPVDAAVKKLREAARTASTGATDE